MQEQIVHVILRELADVAKVDEYRLVPEAELDDLDIDSLDLLELGQIIADRFDVEIQRGDLRAVVTVGEATEILTAKVLGQAVA